MPSSSERGGDKPQVVILCGGYGLRMREYPDLIPKPMVPIGKKPILWHIMNSYARRGYDDFILCLGYRSDVIVQYFKDQQTPWKVTLVDTGMDTMTGGRIKRIAPHLKTETFFIAYGDCVSDIDYDKQLEFHHRHRGDITITGINQRSRFGHLVMGESDQVTEFEEKPILSDIVSGGFFVAERRFLETIDGDEISLESQPLQRVAKDGKLFCYRHQGYWACMDTYRDYEELNSLYAKKDAPWVLWES